jgi:hypothetical protein
VAYLCAAASFAFVAPAAAAEPWSDADPPAPPERTVVGDYGFRGAAEYRANALAITPLSINGASGENLRWVEHRLRLGGSVDWKEKVKLVVSTDLLDGTLWGDNGDFGGDPSSDRGTNVGARNPNVTRPCVTLVGKDPLDRDSYGYGLCSQSDLSIRHAYGEVALPFGVFRIGRQPANIGTGVQNADGEGRPNRFGFSRRGNIVDRVLFATKPLEALKPGGARNRDPDEGLVFAYVVDRVVTDLPIRPGEAVNQTGAVLRFGAKRLGGLEDLRLATFLVHRWDGQYGTSINSFGLRAMSKVGPFSIGFDTVANVGSTREVAAAFSLLSHDPVVDQSIRQYAARGVIRYDHPKFSLYLEGDYASGDPDPLPRTSLTQFIWADDTNVGLLLFKHVLAYQTARAAAAGVETLRRLGATTYPVDTIDTRGAFSNAIAIFPQFDLRPFKSFLIRGGVMAAWAAAPTIDPIASLQRHADIASADYLVNYVGGKPGRFYGIELDGRVQWRFGDHAILDVEGAILFPGDALKDENGYAVRSTMVQARTTFAF